MAEPVRRLINEILKKYLEKAKYDVEKIPELTKQIANEILAGVKGMYCRSLGFGAAPTDSNTFSYGIRSIQICL